MEVGGKGESTSMSVVEAIDFSSDDEAGIDIVIGSKGDDVVGPQRVDFEGVQPVGSKGSGSVAHRYCCDGSKRQAQMTRQLAQRHV